ncbi:hypothetical protein MGG_15360 [Pyricularia oryzae 70-15]|uniref:Uncharacterized protein n=1 Tax=Pyricularia oryzae (strain 70-15 / ATCC MYA-4617 / FGSC 8958) TaxID=242507 RepID=G4N5U4_PYRO7|nr:uncharacterized protein MGG_15360 [Pyricularia oryzae 70-15]EHA49720.1 hypothetical protein MGG_15360 [Pyricularia oryzae 70-15]
MALISRNPAIRRLVHVVTDVIEPSNYKMLHAILSASPGLPDSAMSTKQLEIRVEMLPTEWAGEADRGG